MSRIIEVIRRGQRGLDGTVGLVAVSPKGTGFTATAGERGYVYRCTSPVTMATEAAAVLGNGWHCIVDAVGGNVTVNPNGSELIEGTLSIVIPQGDAALIYTDGVAFYRRSFSQTDVLSANSAVTGSWTFSTGTAANMASVLRGVSTLTATTTGSAFDFPAIPSGVVRIEVLFAGVSLSGAASYLIQIGSGTYENTGYVSSGEVTGGGVTDFTTGFGIPTTGLAAGTSGIFSLVLMDASTNRWAASYAMRSGVTGVTHGGGTKDISGTLDRLRLTRTATDSFDAGSVSVRWSRV